MLNVNGVAINFDGQNLFSNVNLQFLPGNCYLPAYFVRRFRAQ